MFDHLKERNEIILQLRSFGQWEVLDGNIQIFKTTRLLEDGILARMVFGDGYNLRAGVNGCDAFRSGQTRSALREDASSTTNVEIAYAILRRGSGCGVGSIAGPDEIMAQRVHKM